MAEVGDVIRWGGNFLTGRIVRMDRDYAWVEILPDLVVDVDAHVRKFFVPGMVVRIHCSSLETEEEKPVASRAAA
ncbi:MAG: hypothetical protein HYY00_01880 [Chloroflexi bacterium]|nr:hypothetical protein [Chloroflexota bacterium]